MALVGLEGNGVARPVLAKDDFLPRVVLDEEAGVDGDYLSELVLQKKRKLGQPTPIILEVEQRRTSPRPSTTFKPT